MAEDLTPKFSHKNAEQIFRDMESPFGRSIAETFGGMRGNGASFQRGKGDKIFKGDHQGIWLGNAEFDSAPFSVDMDGNLVATSATISGAITASTIDIGGSDATSFHVDADGNMWLGAGTFASAPFRVDNTGDLDIGGTDASSWHVDSAGNMWWGSGGSFAAASIKISNAGAATLTGADVTGTINATAGTFSGSITVSGSLTGGTIRTSSGNPRVQLVGSSNTFELYDSNGDKRVSIGETFSSSFGVLVFNPGVSASTGMFHINGSDETEILTDTDINIQSGDGSALSISAGSSVPTAGQVTIFGSNIDLTTDVDIFGSLTTTSDIDVGGTLNLGSSNSIEDASGVMTFETNSAYSFNIGGDAVALNSNTLFPTHNTFDLGGSSSRWVTIFLVNSPDVSSDIRFKENIKEVGYGLNEVLGMSPISYDKQGRHLGFSAQEIKDLIPEIVSGEEDEEGLGLRYDEMIPVLVNAIKDLKQEIETLKV